jgi:putative DNA primase/helicase
MNDNNFYIQSVDFNDLNLIKSQPLQEQFPLDIIRNYSFQSTLQKSLGKQEIFSEIYDATEKIDFLREAHGDDIVALRKKLDQTTDLKSREILERKIEKLYPKPLQQYVIVIRHLLKTVEQIGLGFGVSNHKTYYFNRKIWITLHDDEFKGFLGEFAEKCGLDTTDAQQFKVKDFLYNQFKSTALMPGFSSVGDITRIPFENGKLVMNDGKVELVDFNKDHNLKYILNFEYDETAIAPLFQKFLDRVLPDKNSQYLLLEFFGTIFLKKIKLEKILLLYGTGRNGKSVLHDIFHALLGRSNITSLSLYSLSEHKSQTRALIENKLLNFSSEIGSTKNMDLDMIKKLASGEPVEIKELYKQPYLMENYAKLTFNCNTLPKDGENTDGFHRRFIIIPFNEIISDEEIDLELAQKIIATELPGIFNLVIKGMNRFLHQGKFTFSELSLEESLKYRREINSVLSFTHDEFYIPSERDSMPIKQFYKLYSDYCKESGFREFSSNKFNSQLRSAGFRIDRSTNGYYHVFYEKLIPNIDDTSIVLNIKPGSAEEILNNTYN